MSYHSGNELVDPDLLFKKAHLQPGMHMADFGCGRTGHIVFPASKIIGKDGVIYAVDILKDVLQNINKRAKIENLTNLHTVWSNVETLGATAIPAKTIDVIFLVNILFHNKDVNPILNEANRLLKDKARLVVIDWNRSTLPFGPTKEELVNFPDITAWGQKNNFNLQEEFKVGKYHTGLVLFKHN